MAAATTAILLALSARYGPHRDELYFVAAGSRPAWGYPDQPPLTPLLAALTQRVAPGSAVALHAPSAVVLGVVVVLASLLARELGGGRTAQILAAVVVATGPGLLSAGHLLSTTTMDLLLWTVVTLAVARALRRVDPRWWWMAGAAASLALLNKHLAVVLIAAVLAGVVLTPDARWHLRTPPLWGAGALSMCGAAPGLVWQAAHGWPQRELAAQIAADGAGVLGRVEFGGMALLVAGPVAGALAVVGVVRLWRGGGPVRALAIAAIITVVVLGAAGGKGYYVLGVVPLLVAAGSVTIASARRRRAVPVVAVVAVVLALPAWPIAVPVLSEAVYAASRYPVLDDNLAETIGWPEVAATVRTVVAETGAGTVITGNYGEAGALEFYGVGVPVFSGHNGFADWGPPPDDLRGPVVAVGLPAAATVLRGCRAVAVLRVGPASLKAEEQGRSVLRCDGPRESWAEIWSQITHLTA
jgi:hypothetical protein